MFKVRDISKPSMLEVLESEESLSHLSCFVVAVLAPHTASESGGVKWGVAKKGVVQGDPSSGDFFCVGLHPLYS